MPLAPEHISKAEHNEKLADTLCKGSYLDWAVTVTFYAALHYVDAILAASVIHPETHTERNDAVGANATLQKVRAEYRTLETLSRNARYRSMKIEPADIQEAQNSFSALRAHLRNRMKLE